MAFVDNAATTKMSRTAIDSMIPYLESVYGNPSSLYTIGQEAKEAMDKARQDVASCFNCNEKEIYFTSGGSEADNQAIFSVAHNGAKKGKKHIILLLASSFVLAGCGNKENTSSSTEKDENQIAYEMISKGYNYLNAYKGDFKRINSFGMSDCGEALDTYKEKIIYDHESNECLYQMDKNESVLYQYFNKKDTDSDSYKMYVNTSVDNQKLKYKSNEECINHFMNLYENPIRYTDYDDVLIDVGGFTALEQLNYIVDLSNSGQPAFLKQASYQDGLEYFKEYFTLIFSEAIQSSSKLNDLSSTFAYEKTNSVTSIKYSGASSTTFEGIDGFDETIIDLEINYIFELDNESRFTSITRTTSFSNCNFKDGQEIEEGSYNFNLTNVETFEYDIGDWTLNEDATGYTDTNTYPLYFFKRVTDCLFLALVLLQIL